MDEEFKADLLKLHEATIEFNSRLARCVGQYRDLYRISAFVKIEDSEPIGVNVTATKIYANFGA